MIRNIFAFDPAGFSVKGGLLGAALVVTILVLAALLGRLGILAVGGTLLVVATGFEGRFEDRLKVALGAIVLGALASAVMLTLGTSPWSSVVLLIVGTYLCSVVMVEGGPAAKAAAFLSMWLAAVVGLGDSSVTLSWPGIGFLLGGLFALAVTAVLGRLKGLPDDNPNASPLKIDWSGTVRRAVDPQSITFQFALIRALAVGISAALGWYLLDVNPFWATITVLIVLQPDVEKTLFKGMQRGIGTVLGAIVGLALLRFVDNPVLLLGLAVLASFFFAALVRANYLWFAAALTIMLLSLYGIGTSELGVVGFQRVIATILGVILAVIAAWAMEKVVMQRQPKSTPA